MRAIEADAFAAVNLRDSGPTVSFASGEPYLRTHLYRDCNRAETQASLLKTCGCEPTLLGSNRAQRKRALVCVRLRSVFRSGFPKCFEYCPRGAPDAIAMKSQLKSSIEISAADGRYLRDLLTGSIRLVVTPDARTPRAVLAAWQAGVKCPTSMHGRAEWRSAKAAAGVLAKLLPALA